MAVVCLSLSLSLCVCLPVTNNNSTSNVCPRGNLPRLSVQTQCNAYFVQLLTQPYNCSATHFTCHPGQVLTSKHIHTSSLSLSLSPNFLCSFCRVAGHLTKYTRQSLSVACICDQSALDLVQCNLMVWFGRQLGDFAGGQWSRWSSHLPRPLAVASGTLLLSMQLHP